MAMEMAFRVTATLRSSSSSPPSSSSSCNATRASCCVSKPNSKPQFRPITCVSLPTSVSLFALFTAPREAKAISLPKEQIVSSITEVEKTIDQVQEVSSSVFDSAQHIFEIVANTLKPGVDLALPILQQAGEQVVKISSPVVSDASKQAQDAIQDAGFDMTPVIKTVAGVAQQTTKAVEVATPIASSTVETITSSDPIVIVGTAGALFVTYLILPSIWSVISYNFRGFKGTLTPAQTLDFISTNNYVLIDIRSETDKNKFGIPRLPSSSKSSIISIPLEELPSKLKGIVRNVKKVEAEIAALKISYLKRISKGSNIIIMDSYSDSAKIVAKALTNAGFGNSWIVADGFSGGRGWSQSRLGVDSYNVSFAQVLSPSRVSNSTVRQLGTTSGTKFLSGS